MEELDLLEEDYVYNLQEIYELFDSERIEFLSSIAEDPAYAENRENLVYAQRDSDLQAESYQGNIAKTISNFVLNDSESNHRFSGSSNIAGIHNSVSSMLFTFDQPITLRTLTATVSSEPNYDFGYIVIDGVEVWKKAGEHNTTLKNQQVNSTLEFKYTKDATIHVGEDKLDFFFSWL